MPKATCCEKPNAGLGALGRLSRGIFGIRKRGCGKLGEGSQELDAGSAHLFWEAPDVMEPSTTVFRHLSLGLGLLWVSQGAFPTLFTSPPPVLELPPASCLQNHFLKPVPSWESFLVKDFTGS